MEETVYLNYYGWYKQVEVPYGREYYEVGEYSSVEVLPCKGELPLPHKLKTYLFHWEGKITTHGNRIFELI